jgi:hypothetical protein
MYIGGNVTSSKLQIIKITQSNSFWERKKEAFKWEGIPSFA